MKLPEEYQYDSWDEVDWKEALIGFFIIGFTIYGVYTLVIKLL